MVTAHRIKSTLIFLTLFPFTLSAQNFTKAEMELKTGEYLKQSIDELREMLSIPNIGSIPEHVSSNVEWMQDAFIKRNFNVSILETEGPPLMLATLEVDQNLATVLFYMHADGQPVDPSRWDQPDPFVPVLKKRTDDGGWEIINWSSTEGDIDHEWRIFARSASDDKGPIGMFLTAMDIIQDENLLPAYNVKVVLDFEEELGSPHLPDAVLKYRDQLSADHMIILDGPRHSGNLPTLTFGARGIQTMTLTVHGPVNPQHSGHYGNYIPNPALRLSQVLASMKDKHGRVLIPGFYDGVELDSRTLEILKAVPDDEEAIKKNMLVAGQDSVATFLQASRQYPSLNIRGMASGWIGDDVRTIVPSEAVAEIDIRLVVESDPCRLIDLVKNHIRELGYHIIDREPTEQERLSYDRLITVTHKFEYEAFRTEIDSPTGEWLKRAIFRAFGTDPVLIRTSGGSVPIAPFVSALDVDAVGVPTVNHDNNQHSPNENVRVGNLYEGIITVLSVLTEPVSGF
ncbi:MAG: M20/M25/M40 family metallo-hydrolase [Balneolaceae bacterium]|nr:MAG: M20/M25/M40 family metallo-hydrolase [Balneolaceae bacterium]